MFRNNTVAKCFWSKFAAVFSLVVGFLLCFGLGLSVASANAEDSGTEAERSGITGVYARLSEEITMKYEAALPDGYSLPEMRFSADGKDFSTDEYERASDGKVVFSYYVKPQNISEIVTAKLYALSPTGEKEKIDEKLYSLEKYCLDIIGSEDMKGLSGKKAFAAKMLATSVLKYGKAAKTLVYGTNSETGLGYERYEVKYDGESLPRTKEATQSDEVVWKSAGVSFSSGVSVYFTARVKKKAGVDFEYSITSNGENYLDKDRITVTENGDFVDVKFYSKAVSPVCFKNEMTATVSAAGNRYGGECRYNVNSCVFNNMTNETFGQFVDSVFCYGKAAALYERIDEEDVLFTSSGSIIDGDYTLNTVCNGYEYSIVLPDTTDDCYDTVITDEQSGACKYVLKRGEYYEAFGEIESEATTIDEAVVIGSKAYRVADNERVLRDTDGKASVTENADGGLELTLNSFANEEKLSVYSKKGCLIKLVGSNLICYGSGQKSLYSTVKLSFSGNGTLKTGVVEAKEISFDGLAWYISTGDTATCEYALKAERLDCSATIEITTKNDYGVITGGDVTIKAGGLSVSGATTGVKCRSMSLSDGANVYVNGQNGMLLAGKLSVSEKANIVIDTDDYGIKANEMSLFGTLEITTKNGTALETAIADKNMFKASCSVTIQRADGGKAKIAVKVLSCTELIVRGNFSIIDYKYYFYTDNENNDSEILFDSFGCNDDEWTIKSMYTRGFLT